VFCRRSKKSSRSIQVLLTLYIGLLLCQGCDTDTSAPVSANAHEIVKSHNIESIQNLLSKGTQVTQVDSDGNSLLHIAARRGEENIFELLLSHGGDVHAVNKYKMTPLHYAAIGGNEKIARILIDNGADVNKQNHGGWTPLYNAGMEGYADVCRLLIENGAKLNIQDNNGDTPLHYAAGNGQLEVVKLYLSEGAASDIKNNAGITPLDQVKERLDPRKNHPAIYTSKAKYAECMQILEADRNSSKSNREEPKNRGQLPI